MMINTPWPSVRLGDQDQRLAVKKLHANHLDQLVSTKIKLIASTWLQGSLYVSLYPNLSFSSFSQFLFVVVFKPD